MSEDQKPIPGTEGAGHRVRPRADGTPEVLKGLRATLNVLSRDFLDLQELARRAETQAAAAATTAGHARDDVARLAEALTGHLDGYSAWRDEVESALQALTEDAEKKPKGQPSWLTIDGEDDQQLDQAVKLLADLAEWIGQVWSRYPDSRLPHCWAYHPWAVTELMAVWQAWKHAYTGKTADPVRVLEWLDRWRPNTAARLTQNLGGCSLSDHVPGGNLTYLPARTPGGADHLEAVAQWWAITHGGQESPVPTAAAVQTERAETP